MKFTPLFAAEVQMMTPPRHQPRRSGRIRSSFRYSADDVRCKDCTRYDSGHPCHLNECVCLEERIEAGVVELNALARECFGGRMFRPLQRRLRDELNRQPFRFFLGDAHRERWTHWKNRCYQRITEGVYGYGQQRLQETLGLDDEAIYELDGYMDFEKYGQDCMENDCVTKTEFGLLRRLDPPFPEQTQGQQMFQ